MSGAGGPRSSARAPSPAASGHARGRPSARARGPGPGRGRSARRPGPFRRRPGRAARPFPCPWARGSRPGGCGARPAGRAVRSPGAPRGRRPAPGLSSPWPPGRAGSRRGGPQALQQGGGGVVDSPCRWCMSCGPGAMASISSIVPMAAQGKKRSGAAARGRRGPGGAGRPRLRAEPTRSAGRRAQGAGSVRGQGGQPLVHRRHFGMTKVWAHRRGRQMVLRCRAGRRWGRPRGHPQVGPPEVRARPEQVQVGQGGMHSARQSTTRMGFIGAIPSSRGQVVLGQHVDAAALRGGEHAVAGHAPPAEGAVVDLPAAARGRTGLSTAGWRRTVGRRTLPSAEMELGAWSTPAVDHPRGAAGARARFRTAGAGSGRRPVAGAHGQGHAGGSMSATTASTALGRHCSGVEAADRRDT